MNISAGSSRFCAIDRPSSAVTGLDCYVAQTYHLTMVETTFRPSGGSCANNGKDCVYFDISLIPSNCTDTLWQQNRCTNTGGAAYNLPVGLICGGQERYTYMCRGPVGRISRLYPSAIYPTNCGRPYPQSTCTGYSSECNNAYFYPMFTYGSAYQPTSACFGTPFIIAFLNGQ